MSKLPKPKTQPDRRAKEVLDYATMDEAELAQFKAQQAGGKPLPAQKGKAG